ncbi:MAG: glutaredoxin family protein [Pseudomonadales bacterium]|nr:glutaredoxin family protein [Pseudomonadales bacterium]NIX09560.1 glutaredoxin family protein [Pseudomonadales bacterium]
MNETGLILFSTDYCALCDEALGLLLSMPELAGISLRVVDVADDDELVTAYGQRLPVLCFAGRELDWPFGANDVLRWIRKIEQA